MVSASPNSTSSEYLLKANFIAKFPSFVEWPKEAFSSPQAPILLCVYGYYPFGTSLGLAASGQTVRGRRMEVRLLNKEENLRLCHIVFVSHSEAKKYNKVFEAVRGASVMTIGETPEFLDVGGTMSFVFQQESLKFEVNLDAVTAAHLKISSRLLALAKHVASKVAEARR
jgi:hypothetical protein